MHVAEDLVDDAPVRTAVMGVMYAVCKDKATSSLRFAVALLALDWLQVRARVVSVPGRGPHACPAGG